VLEQGSVGKSSAHLAQSSRSWCIVEDLDWYLRVYRESDPDNHTDLNWPDTLLSGFKQLFGA